MRARRKELGVRAVFNRVDTCAAEFESFTPYLYSSYESECEADPVGPQEGHDSGQRAEPHRAGNRVRLLLLPRVASRCRSSASSRSWSTAIPETVSTDYDTSDRLYFEPLTLEDVLNICDTEKPDGVIVQFGGQTPLNLALPLKRAGVPIIGTDPENIDLAEDRKLFGKLLDELRIPSPPNGTATSVEEALRGRAHASAIPVLVRPSYVLGGRAMVIAYDEETVRRYMREAVIFSQDRPVLIDRFLEDATEVDVDALVGRRGRADRRHHGAHRRGRRALRRQLLRAAAASHLATQALATIEDYTVQLARALNVIGLMNVQYAIQNGEGLRARSESARLAHGALRQQGDRRAAAEDRGRPDAGQQAEGLRASDRRAQPASCRCRSSS